jgi:glycosyltransferase involved in cell wall biosynthesis
MVANSEAGRSYLIDKGLPLDKTRVIYNGINLERLAVDDNGREQQHFPTRTTPVVGIVARLDKEKDHHTFLRAASLINSAMPKVQFLVVGDGPLCQELERQARELGLEENVIFTGRQLRVAPYIERFDIAVLSSNANEGCSNFLLEAMAMGKPIVATDIGGNRELVANGENGFLVPAGEPVELAEAVLRMLKDRSLAKAMSEKGRRKFEAQFSIQRMVEDYQNLYLKLLRQKAYEPSFGVPTAKA